MSVRVLEGDSLAMLRTLPAGTFQTCVTSPPYFGLRDYGVEGQMGLEESPEAFIAGMVSVFREVRRVLRDDGTLWLNIGDSYAGPNNGYSGDSRPSNATSLSRGSEGQRGCGQVRKMGPGLKTKDLIGIPWMLAFALRADGWYLRADIIWHKPNPMPESIKDRPTKAHEYVFLLTKQPRYFYDADAIAEGVAEATVVRMAQNVEAQRGSDRAHAGAKTNGPMKARVRGVDKQRGHSRRHAGFNDRWDAMSKDGQASMGRNSRSVWSIATEPFSDAHFATMPTELARRCILAGSREGDAVLDPFGGAGTTALVADRLKRDATIIELNPAYAEMARARLRNDAPLLADVA